MSNYRHSSFFQFWTRYLYTFLRVLKEGGNGEINLEIWLIIFFSGRLCGQIIALTMLIFMDTTRTRARSGVLLPRF